MGGMAGGSGIGQGLVNNGIKMGGVAPQPTVGTEYTPVTPNVYQSPFSSIQSAVQPAFQGGEGLGGLKAGVAPNTSNITPMPTMTHDLVQPAGAPVPMPIMGDNAPRFEGPRTGGPGMGPPSDLVQQPTQPTPQVSPVVQQMMMRQQPMFNPQMQRLQGLQQLYSMFSRPQMRMPMQMPMYRNPALAYRPDMQQVQQNLGRVKPSVYKTDLDAARSRIAELEAAEQARQQAQYNYNYWMYNQG